MPGLFLEPFQCIRSGYLTRDEVTELQNIADRYQTTFYVVGSRATGRGRNINSHLTVGKEASERSDIDVRINSQKDIDTSGRLSNDIANVSRGAGKSMPLIGKDAPPPAIIFQPKKSTGAVFTHLCEGFTIYSTRFISSKMIRHWEFGYECENHGRSFAEGTSFKIGDINRTPGNIWIKVIIPGSSPHEYLKINGEEYRDNFEHI